jgi:hypothetical protein
MSSIHHEAGEVTPPKQLGSEDQEKNYGSILTTVMLSKLKTLRINDHLYGVVHSSDPAIIALADSIRKKGLLEPIVVSSDDVVISGHRRRVACRMAGLKTVPVRKLVNLKSSDPAFVGLLPVFNEQRVKSREQQTREEFAKLSPEECCKQLAQRRKENQSATPPGIILGSQRRRPKISAAREGFLNAALKIINDMNEHWPLTDRQIHYQLLNSPPLIHAKKPKSLYRNDQKSYKQLCKLLTQARVEGRVPFDVIHDPTRPSTSWQVDKDVGLFLNRELNGFLTNFNRDLMQSQPIHLEIIGEKMTIENIIKPIAMDYGVPVSIARGYSSISLCYDVKQRFRESNKDKLVVLMLSDFDPEGEDLVRSFGKTLRDDLKLPESLLSVVKVTLTSEQVRDYKLPPAVEAKKTSTRHKKFSKANGHFAYELEALPPSELQKLLRAAIDSQLNIPLFNSEVAKWQEDRKHISAVREKLASVLPSLIA